MSKTDLYNDLIEFNKKQQIESRIDLCNRDPQRPVCNNVSMNNNNEWEWNQYYSKNNNEHLFSKGIDRFKRWKELESIELYNKEIKQRLTDIRNSNKHHFYFVISALIIIFQVFGDGNHRTAAEYFKKMIKSTIKDTKNKNIPTITDTQMTNINNILRRFDYLSMDDDKLLSIINELNNIISNDISRGGKTTIKKRTKKRYTQRRKTIL